MKVYQTDSVLLIPIAPLLELAEIRYQVRNGAIAGRIEPERVSFRIDPALLQGRIGNRTLAPGPADLAVVNRELYGSLGFLAGMFDLTATVDPEGASIFVHNPDSLPVARRLRREAARAVLVGGSLPSGPDLILRGRGGGAAGGVLAYDVSSSSHDPTATTAYQVGAATAAAGGSLLMRLRGTGESAPEAEAAWSGVWPESRWLTQLRLGDGALTGPRPQGSRGVALSNAPFARPLLVEDLPFAGSLPPDWSIEAYRGGQLIGFDSVGPSGRYVLTLPVQYGENPVDLVAYGPLGEVRTFNRTFRALPSMLPAGALEYGLSAGDCRSDLCSANANLDLHYGVSRRLTVRGGLDQFWRRGGSSLSHPYAGITAAPNNALGVELEAVARALLRGGLRVEPSTRLRLTADHIRYADSVQSPFLQPGTRHQSLLYGRVAPGDPSTGIILEAQARRTEKRTGVDEEGRAGLMVRAANTVLRPYARIERQTSGEQRAVRSYVGSEATLLPRPSLGPVLGKIWAQLSVELEEARSPSRAALTLVRNLGPAFRLEGGARWERGSSGPVLSLALVSQLDVMRAATLVTAPTTGPARLDQSVSGAVVWNRNAAVTFSADPSLERGGVAGRVFLDVNADGTRQAEEPALPGTRLLVANRWCVADSSGLYQVWGLSPYEHVLVAVDTASLASPWWVPAFGSAAVFPATASYRTVDVPVLIGGIVEGSLLLEGAPSVSLGRSLRVILIESASGTRTVVETFSDGSFYRMGLPPGRYAAVVDLDAAAELRLSSDTVRFDLRPEAAVATGPVQGRGDPALWSGPSVSGLRLTLRGAAAEHARSP